MRERKRPDTIVYTAEADEETCSVTLRRHVATWVGFGYSVVSGNRTWTPAEVEVSTDPAKVLMRLRKSHESYLREDEKRALELTERHERLLIRFRKGTGTPEERRDEDHILNRTRYEAGKATEDASREAELIRFVDVLLDAMKKEA